jgi:hypothetical protein
MLIVRNEIELTRVLRSDLQCRIKSLLRLRARQLAKEAPGEDLADLAQFAVAQPGDTPADLERAIGFDVFVNPADGSRMGDPDWSPGWEWIEDHGFAYELCFIMSDAGDGWLIIVPKTDGVEQSLLNLCAAHTPAHA